MVSPADVDRVLTYMRHESIFETEPSIDVENVMKIMRHESMIFDTEPSIDIEKIMRIMRHESMIFEPEPSIDVDNIIRMKKHESMIFETEPRIDVQKIMRAVRKVSCFAEDLDEPVDAAFYRSSVTGDSPVEYDGEYECDEHSSGDYSEMQGDSCWGSEWENENEEPDSSPRSGEEASVENTVLYDEDNDRIEGLEGNYECSVCGALHLKPSLLKQHMCTHSDDRLFMCPVENCDREYKSREHLHRHSLTHEGNLFVCAWGDCDQTFNDNSNFERHLELHEKWNEHLLGGSKSLDACLSCPEAGCGKTFRYRSLLDSHIENVHDALSVAHETPDLEKEMETEDFVEFRLASRPGRRKRVKVDHVDGLPPDYDRSQPDLE